MATTKTTKTVAKKAATKTAPATKSVPAKKVTAASKATGTTATVTAITAAKSARATAAKAAKSTAKATPAAVTPVNGNGKPEKTRVSAADLRAALMAGLTHTSEEADDKQYAAVRLAVTAQGLLRVNATDKASAIRVVANNAVTVAGKAFHAVIPTSAIEAELAKPLQGQKDKRVDIWIGPKGGKPHFFVSLDNGKQIAVPLADWTYPNVDKLFDESAGRCELNAPIRLDAARIAVFADAVAEFVPADSAVQAPIRMTFNGPDKAVWMEADLGNRAEIVGLLIPIKDKPVKAAQAATAAPAASAPAPVEVPEPATPQDNTASAAPSEAQSTKPDGGGDQPPVTAKPVKTAKAAKKS